jgi:hypothetical protein
MDEPVHIGQVDRLDADQRRDIGVVSLVVPFLVNDGRERLVAGLVEIVGRALAIPLRALHGLQDGVAIFARGVIHVIGDIGCEVCECGHISPTLLGFSLGLLARAAQASTAASSASAIFSYIQP